MGLHAGSLACKPLYIGAPGPSAMGGWGGSMPPYIDIGIPWTNNSTSLVKGVGLWETGEESSADLRHLWEVHVTVGQMLRLVVVVSGVRNARVVLLHGLVLGKRWLLRVQLRVHHVAAHQGLGPTGHGFCIKTEGVDIISAYQLNAAQYLRLDNGIGFEIHLKVFPFSFNCNKENRKTKYLRKMCVCSYPKHCQPRMTKCLPVQQTPCSWWWGEVGWQNRSAWFWPAAQCRWVGEPCGPAVRSCLA